MMHFHGNPECPLMDTDFASVSEADTEDKFRELRAAFPDMYCTACVPGDGRTDSDRYTELRKLVEAWQNAKCYEDDEPLQALRDWSHR